MYTMPPNIIIWATLKHIIALKTGRSKPGWVQEVKCGLLGDIWTWQLVTYWLAEMLGPRLVSLLTARRLLPGHAAAAVRHCASARGEYFAINWTNWPTSHLWSLKTTFDWTTLLFDANYSRLFSAVRPSPDQRLGPDRVLPANSLTTTWPDGAVLIREHGEHESARYPPKSVWSMLQVRTSSHPVTRRGMFQKSLNGPRHKGDME